MTLIELKDWLSKIPDEFSEYEVFIGGEKKEEDSYIYRIDNPVTTCLVDKENNGIVFLCEHTEET